MSYQRTVTNVQPGASRRGFNGATFTLGAEASNVRRATIQLLEQTNPVAERTVFTAYISDDVDGDGLGAAPSGGVSDAGAGHILNETVANRLLVLQTDENGQAVLDIGQAGAVTKHLVVVDSNGRLLVQPVAFT